MLMEQLTPNGAVAKYVVREDTNDGAIVTAIVGCDEYRLAGRHFTGWALDIGAHIGSVAIALALENPDLQVIAVEPLHENCDVLREAIALNGLERQIYVVYAGAGRDGVPVKVRYDYDPATLPKEPETYILQNRYVGGLWANGATAVVEGVSIDGLAERFGVDRFAFCKIDCEGCEWIFLADGAERIDLIVGEHHHGTLQDLVDMLPDFDVHQTRHDADDFGLFEAHHHTRPGS